MLPCGLVLTWVDTLRGHRKIEWHTELLQMDRSIHPIQFSTIMDGYKKAFRRYSAVKSQRIRLIYAAGDSLILVIIFKNVVYQ